MRSAACWSTCLLTRSSANRFIFGQPAEIASVFTKIASGVTLINSLLSTVCAVILYLALRPALEKAHLLPKG